VWRCEGSPPRHQRKDSLQLAFEGSKASASAIGEEASTATGAISKRRGTALDLPSSLWRSEGSPPRHQRKDSLQLVFEGSEPSASAIGEEACNAAGAIMKRRGTALELPSSLWRSEGSPPRHQRKDLLQLAFEGSEALASGAGLCFPSPVTQQHIEEPQLTVAKEVSTDTLGTFCELLEASPSVAKDSCCNNRRGSALDLPSSSWRIEGSPRGPAHERKDSIQLAFQMAKTYQDSPAIDRDGFRPCLHAVVGGA
jgi:hypothetical protein